MEHNSLYRRYRPRRFSEMYGQEHVVAALQNAVRDDRVHHAYLLSGPRGTGKTTAARILSKALNCGDQVNGEPCCECESCLAVDTGRSFDLHELDAASNNKVEDIRDLLAKVALGTPGRKKIYLLDEVHMLTPGAENALLKTLEEPPEHVVFILATTEPHKVVETIRSRSQHLELGLLSVEQLKSLVEKVVEDAGLKIDHEGQEHAVRSGRGSARDALSALDRVLAGGVINDDLVIMDLLEALAASDATEALKAVASGLRRGYQPRFIGEALLAALREAFLLRMGSDLEILSGDHRSRIVTFIETVPAAKITRSLEMLGSALIEMRRAPDPRVDLEVALIRLINLDKNESVDPVSKIVLQRIERIENVVFDKSSIKGRAIPPAVPSRSSVSVQDGVTLRSAEGNDDPKIEENPQEESQSLSGTSQLLAPDETSKKPATSQFPDRDALALAWGDELLDQLGKKAKARFSAGRFVESADGVVVMALPNEPHLRRCAELVGEVEDLLATHFGLPVPIRLIVEEKTEHLKERSAQSSAIKKSVGDSDDVINPSELIDAESIAGSVVERFTEAFPGVSVLDAD